MSRYADQSNPATIKRWEAEGRGKNTGRGYKPWLYPQDVSSHGYSIRAPGQITGRMHSLLSRYERHFLHILDWHPRVVDIREQYPLTLETTLAISQAIGVNHPTCHRSRRPFVMTTDFLVSFAEKQDVAYCIKPKGKLCRRTMEKFAIEELFWQSRGIKWALVVAEDIPSAFAKNVDWIHDGGKFQDYSLTHELAEKIARELQPTIAAHKQPLSRLTDQTDRSHGCEPGTSLLVVRQLLAAREWTVVDMKKRIDPAGIVHFEKVDANFAANPFEFALLPQAA